jgi:tetratricopeptide (TPR) repeat protein
MLKKYIGKSRADNLDWLTNDWLNQGPPVCFLQGFAGVGKTDLARDFREQAEKQGSRQLAVINEVADRATPSVLESLMELSLLLSQQGLPEMEQVLFEQGNPNPAYALERALQRPVVIILDEAQRFFRIDSGAPLAEMKGILEFLRNRSNLPGRMLLLSDRIVEEARWSEWIPKRTLTKLEPDEAIEAFETKLTESGVIDEIPAERMREVVRDLDFNPRAIEALVGALRYASLDEIIESNPGLWAVRDREISRDFLKSLERDLLERTMRHLDEVHQRKLWRLAVHRRSFKREALEKLCGTKDEATELRSILVTRFLLNFYKGLLALNPIVREISLAHLRDDSAELRQAHSGAADYHLRHFEAKQMVGSQTKLGESFAELRYHLVQAGREAELSVIGQRFSDHLKKEIRAVSPVPSDREELDERIGVLTVLLGRAGAKGLEYHLARCLQSRGKPGDLQQAVVHAQRATGTLAPADSWVLYAQLQAQASGVEAAMRVISTARKLVSVNSSLFSIYQLGAEILSNASKTDEAVALLKDGIKVIPPDKNLFSLYQICADLLAKSGKTDEAVALLKDGIKVIPPDKSLSSLYQMLGEVYCRAGKPAEAIAAQREGLQRIPSQFSRHKLVEGVLYLCAACGDSQTLAEIASGKAGDFTSGQQTALGVVLQRQLQGDWWGAAQAARTSRREFPRYFALASVEAFCCLSAGNTSAAYDALASFPNLTWGIGESHGWLATFIHLRRGARAEASIALAEYLGRPVDESRELNESFLLKLWDQQEVSPESHRLCFRFPIMPASLSRLNLTVRRIQFGKPVLPSLVQPPSVGNDAPACIGSTLVPEVYVSYAWGEDTTEPGRQREEIVNRLCAAMAASGRAIGRDKDRMRGGDSIERFAHEISKATRIVAVISEKSLHSEFCMAHELFRAFRRCDYQRAEFQKKVIALVMDDAKPLLKDDSAVVALAKTWQEKLEKLRTDLHSVDPTKKSSDLWVFVDLMDDMCPRLPSMLGALKDIVMKRGFDEIVADGFQQVISLLPPKA